MKKLIIFGTGQVADIISHYFKNDSNIQIFGFCEDEKYIQKSKFNNLPVFSTNELIKKFKAKDYYVHVALSYSDMNSLRKIKYNFFKNKGYRFLNFISSKSNIVEKNYTIGQNSVILENQSIQPFVKIGDNTMIWSGTVIGHHTKIGNHNWITSGSKIGGNSIIGNECFLGINSTVGHMVKIGDTSFLGANSLTTKSIKKNSVVISQDSKKLGISSKDFLKITYFK